MRTEMSEEMADFWTEVRTCLPGLLKKEGFVSAISMGDPDEVEIFSVWRGGKEEHIATLVCNTAGVFNLFVDTPGTDTERVFRDVSPTRVVVTSMEKRSEECTEYRIWDKEYCHPIKIVTVYAFGRIDMRPVLYEEPDTLEFCPGGRPAGLSSESEDAIKALLSRIFNGIEK